MLGEGYRYQGISLERQCRESRERQERLGQLGKQVLPNVEDHLFRSR